MMARLPRTKSSIAALLILVFALILPAAPANAEEILFLYRGPESISARPEIPSLPARRKFPIRLDDKGDLLIQCGCARFVVAYNDPLDQLKPVEQQRTPQRPETVAINGISVTASISF
ncbi:MAG: hypothetical protein A2X82_03205 [Geobacteraceae bacterium GWC2_55_20]|nr:MAG: hypothetical protein A2X82_03205 [Geobacteraceae bacterium GWC2_55_20]OGU21683.1 MAG: hypothetical protein A2X85_01920 [Geobacteraceae bacterium GWF2_54_21]HBA72453.1 hypothetical protein [Geobacter sp.]HCE67910.1 hypothetical protein [Geobacter sp.]